jgi:hypothetical protein
MAKQNLSASIAMRVDGTIRTRNASDENKADRDIGATNHAGMKIGAESPGRHCAGETGFEQTTL